MTLQVIACKIRNRLELAKSARDNIEEVTLLTARRDELTPLAVRIQNTMQRKKLLSQAHISTDQVEATGLRQTVTKIFGAFTQNPVAGTLTQGPHWNHLLNGLKQHQVILDTTQLSAWQAHCDTQFDGLSPTQVKLTLADIPENQLSLAEYRTLYDELHALRRVLPTTEQDLTRVSELSRLLHAIHFIENDDLPGDVSQFIAATKTPNGASLELLTPNVIEWLSNKSLLSNYRIRPC